MSICLNAPSYPPGSLAKHCLARLSMSSFILPCLGQYFAHYKTMLHEAQPYRMQTQQCLQVRLLPAGRHISQHSTSKMFSNTLFSAITTPPFTVPSVSQ